MVSLSAIFESTGMVSGKKETETSPGAYDTTLDEIFDK